jgi:hypothetical protein
MKRFISFFPDWAKDVNSPAEHFQVENTKRWPLAGH